MEAKSHAPVSQAYPETRGGGWASLSTIPRKLLFLVLRYLSSRELFLLATVSQSLNKEALSFYLEARGVVDYTYTGGRRCDTPLEVVYHHESMFREIRALRLALFYNDIRKLSCRFGCAGWGRIVYELTQVTQLIRLASTVKDIILDFTNTSILPPDTVRCSEAMQDLLQAASEAGCVRLRIQGCRTVYLNRDDSLAVGDVNTTPEIPRISSRDANIMSELHTKYTFQALTALDIDSDIILGQPFFNIIRCILENSPVTSLSFGCAYLDLPTSNWSRLFDRLHCLKLAALSVDCNNLCLTDLSHFIARHPNVVKLTLKNSFSPTPPASRIKTWSIHRETVDFRQITSLRGQPDGLAAFIQSVTEYSPRRSKPFPKLSALSIVFDDYMRGREDGGLTLVDKTLKALVDAGCGEQSIHLFLMDFDAVMFHQWIAHCFARKAKFWKSLHCVSWLILAVHGGVAFPGNVTREIPRFISLFPSLYGVVMAHGCLEDPRKGDATALAGAIAELSQSVRVIEIDGDRRDVSAWLQ